jgi:hypothetical protein
VFRPRFAKPLVTGRLTAVIDLTGPVRLRYPDPTGPGAPDTDRLPPVRMGGRLRYLTPWFRVLVVGPNTNASYISLVPSANVTGVNLLEPQQDESLVSPVVEVSDLI